MQTDRLGEALSLMDDVKFDPEIDCYQVHIDDWKKLRELIQAEKWMHYLIYLVTRADPVEYWYVERAIRDAVPHEDWDQIAANPEQSRYIQYLIPPADLAAHRSRWQSFVEEVIHDLLAQAGALSDRDLHQVTVDRKEDDE